MLEKLTGIFTMYIYTMYPGDYFSHVPLHHYFTLFVFSILFYLYLQGVWSCHVVERTFKSKLSSLFRLYCVILYTFQTTSFQNWQNLPSSKRDSIRNKLFTDLENFQAIIIVKVFLYFLTMQYTSRNIWGDILHIHFLQIFHMKANRNIGQHFTWKLSYRY